MANQNPPQWRQLLGISILLISLTFFPGWAPAGPWGTPSFTRGIVGLIGGGLLYLSWYRYTFETKGIVPTVILWSNPNKSIGVLSALGIGLVFFSRVIGHEVDFVPVPIALIMALVGLLMILLSIYAWLVTEGPLQDEEE